MDDSFEHIINNLQRVAPLSKEQQQLFVKTLTPKNFSKKELILQPGDRFPYKIYVISGVLRSFIIDQKGDEHIIQFAAQDWWISDVYSFMSGEPATIYIEAITPAKVFLHSATQTELLCNEDATFANIYRKFAERAFAYSQNRIITSFSENAEQRFKNFSAQYPDIVNAVPQYYIASYLGITPEFMSKIKAKIARESIY